MTLEFSVLSQHKKSRNGILKTAHGDIRTPAFMPVGTRASVKGMLPESVTETGADVLLGNTYHLMLKPGAEIVEKLGGLHKMMNWNKPILTDSGGFQVMSLSSLRKITEEGVMFSSHIDGSKHMLSPESSTKIQHMLDSNITMAFDECTPYPISHEDAEISMELTNRWTTRSRNAFVDRKGYGQFGIIQGSVYRDLRERSVAHITALDFDGYAIGGVANDAGENYINQVIDYVIDLLPANKPRYLMGVGKPLDIIEAVKRGVDMFDCVIPTRSGRNGQAFTREGTINIKNSKFTLDTGPIEQGCECYACKNYSRGYIHHLVRVGEMLGATLMTWHNIHYYQNLMQRIRDHIEQGKDLDFVT